MCICADDHRSTFAEGNILKRKQDEPGVAQAKIVGSVESVGTRSGVRICIGRSSAMGSPWGAQSRVKTCMLSRTCKSPVGRSGRVFWLMMLEYDRVFGCGGVLVVVFVRVVLVRTVLVAERKSSMPGASCKLPCRLGIFRSPCMLFLDCPSAVGAR